MGSPFYNLIENLSVIWFFEWLKFIDGRNRCGFWIFKWVYL